MNAEQREIAAAIKATLGLWHWNPDARVVVSFPAKRGRHRRVGVYSYHTHRNREVLVCVVPKDWQARVADQGLVVVPRLGVQQLCLDATPAPVPPGCDGAWLAVATLAGNYGADHAPPEGVVRYGGRLWGGITPASAFLVATDRVAASVGARDDFPF